ncbi:MAG: anti-sigma factor [Planctomycetes bacterium]|nr:anti-sigma factor [Planctomycetota bacterium]
MTPDPRRARLDDLLATEATQGLSLDEATELDALLLAFPDEDPDGLERAAAAIHNALARPEPVPPALLERLQLAAVAVAPAPVVPRAVRPRPAWLAWSGWAVAAGLAGVLVYVQIPRRPVVPVPEPTFAELRDALRPQAPEFVGAKQAATGSIVWSDAKQEGYMELRGLAPVDPAAGTYQLWIVDADRKDSEPVDGGVFRVNADGTALVKIRAPIRVKRAAAFAVTRERDPNGVVVSKVKPADYELVMAPKKG